MFLKRTAAVLLCIFFALGLLAGCGSEPGTEPEQGGTVTGDQGDSALPAAGLTQTSSDASENVLRAAVLYDGSDGSSAYQDLYSRLAQPLLLNFVVQAPVTSWKEASISGGIAGSLSAPTSSPSGVSSRPPATASLIA